MAVIGTTKVGGMLNTELFYNSLGNNSIGGAFLHWWIHNHHSPHNNVTIWGSYGMALLGDPTIKLWHHVQQVCQQNLVLSSYPANDHSNLLLIKAGNSITVQNSFIIPVGVHVIFDAPNITFESGFSCPIGASFETRNEGCEL